MGKEGILGGRGGALLAREIGCMRRERKNGVRFFYELRWRCRVRSQPRRGGRGREGRRKVEGGWRNVAGVGGIAAHFIFIGEL